jgi:hypothetical protein
MFAETVPGTSRTTLALAIIECRSTNSGPRHVLATLTRRYIDTELSATSGTFHVSQDEESAQHDVIGRSI